MIFVRRFFCNSRRFYNNKKYMRYYSDKNMIPNTNLSVNTDYTSMDLERYKIHELNNEIDIMKKNIKKLEFSIDDLNNKCNNNTELIIGGGRFSLILFIISTINVYILVHAK